MLGANPGASAILGEMRRVEAADPGQDPSATASPAGRVEAFAAFVAGHAEVLAEFPQETIPVARNHAAGGIVAEQAGPLADALERPWIARDARPPARPSRPVRIRDLSGGVSHQQALAITPDGRTGATGTGEGTIGVWDLAIGECRRVLSGAPGPIRSLALTPDGQTLLAANRGPNLLEKLTSLTGGAPSPGGTLGKLAALTGLQGTSGGARDALDGRAAVRLWDVASETCLREIDAEASCVALSADGRIGVLASKGLEVWDLTGGTRTRAVASPSEVRCLALTPDGSMAVTAHADHALRVWDVVTGACLRVLAGHTGPIAAIAVSPDGRVAVSGGGVQSIMSEDNTVRVWDLVGGRCLRVFTGHAKRVVGVGLSDDGRIVVSAGEDERLRVWDVAAGGSVRILRGPAGFAALAVTANAGTALTAGDDQRLRLWNLVSGVPEPGLPRHDAEAGPPVPLPFGQGLPSPGPDLLTAVRTHCVDGVALASREPVVVSAGDDTTVRIWDMPTGACLATLTGHLLPVKDVALTEESVILSAADDNSLRLWDPVSRRCLRTLTDHGGAVHAVAIAPDGRTAVSGAAGMGQVPYADHTVRVWDLVTGNCLRVLTGHNHWVETVAVSPDGLAAVSGSTDGSLRVWDFVPGEARHVLPAGAGHINDVAISPNARWIAAATTSGGIILWSMATGRRLKTLAGHRGRVRAVGWSVDAWTLASGCDDQTLRVWDPANSACLATYHAGSAVRSVTPIRGDGRLACGTADGQVHMLTLRARPIKAAYVTASRRTTMAYDADLAARPAEAPSAYGPGETIPSRVYAAPVLTCPFCGTVMGLSEEMRAGLAEATSRVPAGMAPTLLIPDEAHNDSRLTGACPDCKKTLWVNPFVVGEVQIEPIRWRDDPLLQGKFHAECPDDVQVLVHDGHPGLTGRGPESVWVRIHGKKGRAYRGTMLNQPDHLQSRQGEEVLFLALPGYPHTVMVTEKYLAERETWDIEPCTQCGLPETFSAPSDLLERTDVPPPARPQIRQLTSPCPMCGGTQLLKRK
jgi:WD40 repeat protein